MATTDRPSHLPPLGAHENGEVGKELQGTLLALIALSLIGKQLHWNVTGPLFRPLHLQLDELVDSWRDLSDVVAERAVAIGYAPDGRAPTVVSSSGLQPMEAGPVEDHVALRELVERVAWVAERTRERADRVGELDIASQDVLIEVLRALEQQLWMIRAQLPGS